MQGNFGFASTLLNTLKKYKNTCPVMLSSSIQATLVGRYANGEYGKSKKAGEELFFSYAEKMYLTQVNEIHFNADTFFPEIDARNWDVRDLMKIDEDGHQAVIREYIRKK